MKWGTITFVVTDPGICILSVLVEMCARMCMQISGFVSNCRAAGPQSNVGKAMVHIDDIIRVKT